MTDIVLYMHVHQPHRIRHYTIFDSGNKSDYFEADQGSDQNNRDILNKVSDKSYLPTNAILKQLLEQHPEFRVSLSISGTILEQIEAWRPDVLESFQELMKFDGRVEIVGETYHHSLAFFEDRNEFERQVLMHTQIVQRLLGYTPHSFRNTELSYNNELGVWCNDLGYDAVITEGWDPILDWRSPNFVYSPQNADNTKLLVKNYKLSDDIAFRFSNQSWPEWPMTADKFTHWIHESIKEDDVINLFMDFETFGEHQWEDTGIFEFLKMLPNAWMKNEEHGFATISEAAKKYDSKGELDIHNTITWADSERDLSAWTGNNMQLQSLRALYELGTPILDSKDWELIDDWRKLQTSDHFYYMCTKWWSDGDVHAYFSPYKSPYEAHMNFMNAVLDLKSRLARKGVL